MSQTYELEGTVKKIFEMQTFNSGFTKREFVVTTDDKYPQDIKMECIKDKCDLLNSISENDRVKVSFNLRGNEYKERFYVNLQAWRVEPAGAQEEAQPVGPMPDGMEEDPFGGEEMPF